MSNLINCLIGKINKLEKKVCKLQNGQGGPCEVCSEVKLNLYILNDVGTEQKIDQNVNLNIEYSDCTTIKNITEDLKDKTLQSCVSLNSTYSITLTDVKINSFILIDVDAAFSQCYLTPVNAPIYVNSNCNEYSVLFLFNDSTPP